MCVDDHTVCIMSILKIFFLHIFVIVCVDCLYWSGGNVLFCFLQKECKCDGFFIRKKKSEKFMIFFLCRERKKLENFQKNDH